MSESPAPRPSWQFSGRRGTPVHKRSEATAALPPEIRQVVDQLVRERGVGETPTVDAPRTTPPDASALTPTSHGLRKPASTPTTPVSASPRPVERRAPIAADATSQPTIIPPTQAPAPAAPARDLPAPAQVAAPALDAAPTPVAASVEPALEPQPADAAATDDDDSDEPNLLQRTRRLISLPLRRPRADAPVEELPAAIVASASAPEPTLDALELKAAAPAEPATTPEPVASELTTSAVPVEPAPTTPTTPTSDATAGLDAARIAGSIVGQPPIIAELAPAAVPAPAGPAPIEAASSEIDAPRTDVAEPAASVVEPPSAPSPTSPAAAPKSVRPRSGKRGGKRRRGSIAWESARPRTPIEADTAGPVAPSSTRAASTTPIAITRLDAPLHAPTERTNDEPRFTRQRAVARRSELDVALSDLEAFVDTTTSRRS